MPISLFVVGIVSVTHAALTGACGKWRRAIRSTRPLRLFERRPLSRVTSEPLSAFPLLEIDIGRDCPLQSRPVYEVVLRTCGRNATCPEIMRFGDQYPDCSWAMPRG
jgi:hypothetical protein